MTACKQCLSRVDAERPLSDQSVAQVGYAVRKEWGGVPVIGCTLSDDHWHFQADDEPDPALPFADWFADGCTENEAERR